MTREDTGTPRIVKYRHTPILPHLSRSARTRPSSSLLAARISEKPKDGFPSSVDTERRKPVIGKSTAEKAAISEANPPHGEKGDFIKVTVTLPPEVYQLIMAEAVRRKMQKQPNPQLSAVIREAVVHYLEQKD